MIYAKPENLFDNPHCRKTEERGEFIEIGVSATVTDLLA